MRYTLEQRIFMYDEYIKHKNFVECCVAFIQKYPGVKIPRKSVVRKLVAKFRTTGSLLDEIPGADKRRNKGLIQIQTKDKTSRLVGGQCRRSNGPATRAVTRNARVSSSDTGRQQEAIPFTFVGIKQEVEDKMDIIDLESDSDSNMQEPCDDTQQTSLKEEPPDTSSSEMSDSDFKKELEGDTDITDGGSGSDSDTQEHCDKTQVISVKEEPPDTRSSELSEQEPFTFACVNIKEEAEDCVHVNGVQSDSGDKEQVLTVTGGCQTFENEAVQIPAVFTSVEVKCEVEDELAGSDE